MSDPANPASPLPGAGAGAGAETAAAVSKPAAPDTDASAPALQSQQSSLPVATSAAQQLASTGAVPAAQGSPAPGAPAPDSLLQPAGVKPSDPSLPATPADGDQAVDDDVALALLQQPGLAAPALTLEAGDREQPAKPGNKDASLPGSSIGCDQGTDRSQPDLTQAAASAAASQASAVGSAGADPAAPSAGAQSGQTAAIATLLSRPALPAFPRSPLAIDARRTKDADRADTPPALDPSEPQGIAPASDKANLIAESERKSDAAPAVQHRSAADLTRTLPDSGPATQASLLDPATSAGNSNTAAATSASHTASAAGASTASSATQSQIQLQPPVPLSGVPVLIASRALAGDKHFDIRLDPPELGRIEVRLKVGRDGQISSHLIADRPDTLALLRRDETGLERALQDAGFKTAGDGLQFSLRDQNGNSQAETRSTAQPLAAEQDPTTRLDAIPSGYVRYSGRVGGLDIRV